MTVSWRRARHPAKPGADRGRQSAVQRPNGDLVLCASGNGGADRRSTVPELAGRPSTDRQPTGIQCADDARLHLGRGVPVDRAHRARAIRRPRRPPGRGMAHQLINHPCGNAVVLQPGREGVAQVVRAAQVQADQVAVPGGLPDRPQVAVAEHVAGRLGEPAASAGRRAGSGRAPRRQPRPAAPRGCRPCSWAGACSRGRTGRRRSGRSRPPRDARGAAPARDAARTAPQRAGPFRPAPAAGPGPPVARTRGAARAAWA